MFPDMSIQQYGANIIAENIYSHVDEEGHRLNIMDEIIDHRKGDEAIEKADGHTTNQYDKRSRRITTKGWSFLINGKDGFQSWVPLKGVKESNHIEVAEYARSRGLDEEPHLYGGYHIHSRKEIE